MADAGVMKAGDRLPWLEPYRAPSRPKPARRGLTLAAAAIIALAGGSSLFVMRDAPQTEAPSAPPSARVALPAPADLQPKLDAPEIRQQAELQVVRPAPTASAPVRRRPKRKVRRIVSAGPERDAYEVIMSEQIGNADLAPAPVAQPAPAPPPPEPLRPAVNPSASVVRGKTAQLGVYLTARQAELAWRSAIREYTFLVTMPKSIEPIRIRSKRYYRLQLGTPSKRHARQLCSNLRSTGRACVVA